MTGTVVPVGLDSVLVELHDTILSCFNVLEPFSGLHPTLLFHSHYDWHSSVHGHWAYFVSARMKGLTKSDENVRKILDRITFEVLNGESIFLRITPTFELPYGQSWLLLLLPEVLKWIDEEQTELIALIRRFHQETTDRVLKWLEESAYPDGKQG